MIEVLEQAIAQYETQDEKYQYLRETLQLIILNIMDKEGLFQKVTFMGGTALRIIYDLNRFSEDLDFCVKQPENYDLSELSHILARTLEQSGIATEIVSKDHKTVATAKIKFPDILFKLGLSSLKDQKLMIKLEIDQNPPTGFNLTSTFIQKLTKFEVNHLDLSSLFSGKLHALFCRRYTKGRDYYDLLWYLGKQVKPNIPYLNAGLAQQGDQRTFNGYEAVCVALSDLIEQTNFKKVLGDVEHFLLDPKEARFFNQDTFLQAIAQSASQ